jgi:hypothetical protein
MDPKEGASNSTPDRPRLGSHSGQAIPMAVTTSPVETALGTSPSPLLLSPVQERLAQSHLDGLDAHDSSNVVSDPALLKHVATAPLSVGSPPSERAKSSTSPLPTYVASVPVRTHKRLIVCCDGYVRSQVSCTSARSEMLRRAALNNV